MADVISQSTQVPRILDEMGVPADKQQPIVNAAKKKNSPVGIPSGTEAVTNPATYGLDPAVFTAEHLGESLAGQGKKFGKAAEADWKAVQSGDHLVDPKSKDNTMSDPTAHLPQWVSRDGDAKGNAMNSVGSLMKLMAQSAGYNTPSKENMQTIDLAMKDAHKLMNALEKGHVSQHTMDQLLNHVIDGARAATNWPKGFGDKAQGDALDTYLRNRESEIGPQIAKIAGVHQQVGAIANGQKLETAEIGLQGIAIGGGKPVGRTIERL